jgi:hypothetical protein
LARLLWLTIHAGEAGQKREQRALGFPVSGGEALDSRLRWNDRPESTATAQAEAFFGAHRAPLQGDGKPTVDGRQLTESRVASPESRTASPESPSALARRIEFSDAECEFRASERRARLHEALRRLCEALYPEVVEGHAEGGGLFRLKNDFDRLRPDPVWSDPQRRAVLRQDLGLDPKPADFEMPVVPLEFLDPYSPARREWLESASLASWRRRKAAQWKEDHAGLLLTAREAAEMEAGRLSLEDDWRAVFLDRRS